MSALTVLHSVRRRCIAFSLFSVMSLLIGSSSHAQSMPSAGSTDRGLFWKVEKDGRTSYLLGTVHAWKREWLPLNPTIEKAFADSKTLAVELDAAKMDMASAVQRMMLAGNDTLEARLGKSLYEQTRSRGSQAASARGSNRQDKAVGRDARSGGDEAAATGI